MIATDSGKPVGDIAKTPGGHGIPWLRTSASGLISNGREGTVSVFELNSLKVHSKVKVGENPDAILYDPASKRVFTFTAEVMMRLRLMPPRER